MKKIISVVLLLSLLLVCVSSCTAPSNATEETTSSNIEETTLENSEETTQDIGVAEIDEDSDLIVELVDYLRMYHYAVDPVITSVSIKLDEIKDGKQPLQVAFDPSDYYFVCAYHYNDTHDENMYCCATEYIWVRYEHERDIREYYKAANIVVAFQFNKSLFVTDILSDEASAPNMEHFQLYEPEFSSGINTEPAIVFDKTFIYLNSSDKSNVYHSTSAYYNEIVTFPCICIDNQFYVLIYLYRIYSDGSRSEENLDWEFGEYYDELVNVMDTNKYSVTDKNGTSFYGVITIDDFADVIK